MRFALELINERDQLTTAYEAGYIAHDVYTRESDELNRRINNVIRPG